MRPRPPAGTHGPPDLQSISYKRLVIFTLALIAVTALVQEIVLSLGGHLEQGTGRMAYQLAAAFVALPFFLANLFVARTYQRSHVHARWLAAIVIVSGLFGVALFIPEGNMPSFLARRLLDIVGELGFLGMGGVSVYAIAMDLLTARRIKPREIWGSIALYALVGILFACLYGLLGAVRPDSFSVSFSPGHPTWNLRLYFSFVTQATLGYGDIVPKLPLARNLTVIQAMFGVLYPPIILARLMNLYREEE